MTIAPLRNCAPAKPAATTANASAANVGPGRRRTGSPAGAARARAAGRVVGRGPLRAAILNSFERAYEGAASGALFHGWRVRLETLGRSVTVTLADGQAYEGIAEGVADDGALLLRLRSGELRTLHAGEVMSQAAVRPATAPPAR